VTYLLQQSAQYQSVRATDLVATLVAELPEEVFMESSDIPSSTISSVSKCKRNKESVIVEALWEH